VAVEKAVALEKVVIPVEKAGKPQNLLQTGENAIRENCSGKVFCCGREMHTSDVPVFGAYATEIQEH
jgi:hypothetical protein